MTERKYIAKSNTWFKQGTECELTFSIDDTCGVYEGTYVVGSCNPDGYDKFWYNKGYSNGDEVTMSEVCQHSEFTFIDVRNCIGCRKGESLFIKTDDGFSHLDLFASYSAGATYNCPNSKVIESHLTPNGDKGTYLADDKLTAIYNAEGNWWEDIVSLANQVLNEQQKVSEFFNQEVSGVKMWNRTNVEIENSLMKIVDELGFKIDEEEYPDLIKWN